MFVLRRPDDPPVWRSNYPIHSSEAYYRAMLEKARETIGKCRHHFPGVPITFVSHPLTAPSTEKELENILRLGFLLMYLSMECHTFGFNQLPFYGRFNQDDPRDFVLKFEIFYRGLIAECDQLLLVPGYEASTGCRKELGYAEELGKPVFLLRPEHHEFVRQEAVSYIPNEYSLPWWLDFEDGDRVKNLRLHSKYPAKDWETFVVPK